MMSAVAVAPLFLSSRASMMTPWACPVGFDFRSSMSATSSNISSSSAMPVPFFAETGTQMTSPPNSSITTP